MKKLCLNCGKNLGSRSYQFESGEWVATGKFPTIDFCGPECGGQWHRRAFGAKPRKCADQVAIEKK
jgi:hypothetical protein